MTRSRLQIHQLKYFLVQVKFRFQSQFFPGWIGVFFRAMEGIFAGWIGVFFRAMEGFFHGWIGVFFRTKEGFTLLWTNPPFGSLSTQLSKHLKNVIHIFAQISKRCYSITSPCMLNIWSFVRLPFEFLLTCFLYVLQGEYHGSLSTGLRVYFMTWFFLCLFFLFKGCVLKMLQLSNLQEAIKSL